MKKAFLITLSLALSGTGFAQAKKFVTLRADIANRNGDVIFIKENRNILKEIRVNKDGFFKDTLSVKKDGMYMMYDGVEYTQMYLKNGYDLKLKMDAKNFDASIVYEGVGAAENNYLAKSTVLEHEYEPTLMKLITADEAEFKKGLEAKKTADLKRLKATKLDPNFVALQTKEIEESAKGLESYYAQKAALKKLNNTTPPTFSFDNYKGGTAKLEDYRGKYVYIDVWATWCGPCRAEIPHLKKLEEKYHGKNIEFVSISFDNPKDVEKWKNMVKTKEMGGEQLITTVETHKAMSSFFQITGIPRFILLDPNGKVVNADAPRPSDPDINQTIDSVLN
ncbi:MAG: TlpA family protein disulfide reductase [Flavobacterium sp.]